jgi:signal transduction histidine kinase
MTLQLGQPFTVTAPVRRARLRRTVRLRLALLHGAMFCVCGGLLLAITYLLVRYFSGHVLQVARSGPLDSARSAGGSARPLPALPSLAQLQSEAQRDLVSQHNRDLRQLLIWSVVALAATGAGSLAIGWLAADRVLAPLRTMTAAARRISQDNLHERLALEGPADELRELGDTIDALLARLEAAFDAQRRFVANASHELRTPLARIRTALDVAVGKPAPVPPQVLALDRKIREGLDRADRLMEGLLLLGQAEHGELGDQAAVALNEVIDAALAEQAADIADRAITVERDLVSLSVPGNPTLIGRMVENVIDNGVRHNQPGGWLRVALAERGGRVELTVESSGETLDPGQVADLGRPFRRLRAERTGSARGAGLGLSIVAAIATAHHGALTLRARDEGGLRLLIELPRAPDAHLSRPSEADLPHIRDRGSAATTGPLPAPSGNGFRCGDASR